MRNPRAVVAAGLVHNKQAGAGSTRVARRRESLNTLLGFETTSPQSRTWFGERVVALSWWWGVVFDLWIVVASIMPARVSSSGGAGVG